MSRKRRRRRIWADSEKRMICRQTRVAGVSVSQVARRYDVNSNLVFNWLRDPRYAPAEEEAGTSAEGGSACKPTSPVRFLPVELVAEPIGVGDPDDAGDGSRSNSALDGVGVIEIELSGGHRLRITGRYDPDALSRLLRGLSG